MKYAVDSNEMKLIDNYTIQTLQTPQAELMERAAGAVAATVQSKIKKSDRILVICGLGNNGGDGIATGRILYLQGYHVAFLFIGEEEKASAGYKAQMEIAKNLGITVENPDKLHEYNIIIDAIFGVGLLRPVTGVQEEIINKVNRAGATVFSVDIPSGISADNGSIMNVAVRADYTITFGYQKLGLILYPGADYAGEITVADIGFPEALDTPMKPNTIYYEPEDLYRIPARKNYSHKGTYGKVLIIGGSKGMSGAAYLSAKAAYRTGAGLVKVLTAEDNRVILQTSLPEALFAAYDDRDYQEEERKQRLLSNISWADVIVIGPGLGVSKNSLDLLLTVIKAAEVPVIVDADGITMLAGLLHDELRGLNSHNTEEKREDTPVERLSILTSLSRGQLILTPHLMELSRLIDLSISDIANNLVDTARQCSYNNNLVYAIKDARTIVTQGDKRYINISGNNGMATGGSGDVLTGIIAALIAQGMVPYDAVCLAVYIHGLAGDFAAEEKGRYSMMAGDIVASIEKVLKQIHIISQ